MREQNPTAPQALQKPVPILHFDFANLFQSLLEQPVGGRLKPRDCIRVLASDFFHLDDILREPLLDRIDTIPAEKNGPEFGSAFANKASDAKWTI